MEVETVCYQPPHPFLLNPAFLVAEAMVVESVSLVVEAGALGCWTSVVEAGALVVETWFVLVSLIYANLT